MNVKLATQLLTRSVAKAIDFCNKTLNIPAFRESESTVEFIKILNDLFDTLNTTNNNIGLLGLLVCINSLTYLYKSLVATDILFIFY